MKKTIITVCIAFLSNVLFGQTFSKIIPYAENVTYTSENKINFIRFQENNTLNETTISEFINQHIFNNGLNKVVALKKEKDELGFTNIKFSIFQNGILISNKVIIAHFLNNKLVSLNGDLYAPAIAKNNFSISEKKALTYALSKVNAKKYKWDNKAEEEHMRTILNEPNFSYYPHGSKVVFEKEGINFNAYQFNIYAEDPLYRANVFVDASTGMILDEQNLICTTDVPATCNTKFSGPQTFTVDYTGSLYRLRETQRGQGIETYNLHNSSSYLTATDFTNSSTSWTTTGFDQAATDAHWGAEKTYDYYLLQHNRNSINNNGFKLYSYVHYQTNYANAFWDGQRMTYGDGNSSGSMKIFTALDVCGHEITHGLTSNTGAMVYSNESGALNESYSDIFGTAIENFGRPSNWNWKIGEDITNNGNGLRSMSNPNAYGDPDTYGGTYYYNGTADNGGVHTNSGVSNFWFYLLTSGGSGTNDLSNAYSVSGIGITSAAKIAFRALTVYYTPTTNYAMARQLTIQAAIDLFGSCSNELIQTTKAWYAVGVGANYITGLVGPNFTSNITNFCSAPANVTFNNTTTNGFTYNWSFGDGATASTTNAVHTYSAVGVYAVKLKATGCASALDSITKTAFIVVNGPIASPLVTSSAVACENTPITLVGSGNATLKWYDSATGGTELGVGSPFATSGLSTSTTFYAANTITLAPVYGGLSSFTGGGYSNVNTNYLLFNVFQNSILNSVVVKSQSISDRVIELKNASNVVLYTTTVNIGIGTTTVILNYNLTPGTNYKLGLNSASASSLYRTNTGVTFPYNIGGAAEITNSSTGTNAYYFFYDWKISKEECASTRVPVSVSVHPAPSVTMTAPDSPVCVGDVIDLQGTPSGGAYIGNTVTGSMFSASNGAGTYSVSYKYTDAYSCSSTVESTLIVEECTSVSNSVLSSSSVQIYPSPVQDNLMIKGVNVYSKLIICDALGRVTLTKELYNSEEKINIADFVNGIYVLSIQDETGKTIKTSKIIKN
ncbi:M4 family metallopeptidase [Aurantibacillus circumpalustris]|uniref:M4 family metallopeptidase n=1 Tax=Aurantibacillus circumpalustris TaxID=3036359 RepID=UPI00295AC6B6|nr:M4 family metallopeptidase [Aurantibacillus circumpalustris]